MPPGKSLKVLDFLVKFRGPGKFLKMTFVLESPGNYIWQCWIVLEKLSFRSYLQRLT